jgi:predicted double-glycine peptidase
VRWFALLFAFQQALWIDVPFTRQEKNGCGSASIWMVMKYWKPDISVDVDDLQQQLYSKDAGGIYAKDMVRYFESHGYRAFAFRGDWSDLQNHISKGRPLIVCLEQNSRGVLLHYVVVAGIDDAQDLVLLNDPAQRKLLAMPRAEFEQRWRTTNNWTLLAVPEIDLASAAFRDEKLAEAREHLASALRTDPEDRFTNDFLGSVFFLQDNTEAALKYWNRAGKPAIDNIRIDPPLRINPVLLDRGFAFSRGNVLELSDFEDTEARLSALGVFSRYRMELTPAESGRFDVTLRAAERNGPNSLSLLSWASGLPFETVRPQLSNIGGKAVNLDALIRWDSNKRRAFAAIDSPLRGDPKWGVRLTFDARDENWASSDAGFHMRKFETTAQLKAVPSGRWQWMSGAAVSRRSFSNTPDGGFELKYTGSAKRTILRDPVRDMRIDSSVGTEAGKLFGSTPLRFVKFENATSFHWRSASVKTSAGTIIGQMPFDERFVIGLDRDSDLWLRAHSATLDGRKNAASTSRAFIVMNSDFQKTVFNSGLFQIKTGPFVDAGKSSISPRWVVDSGLEMRFSVLGSIAINISYGWSLRDAQRALFARVGP